MGNTTVRMLSNYAGGDGVTASAGDLLSIDETLAGELVDGGLAEAAPDAPVRPPQNPFLIIGEGSYAPTIEESGGFIFFNGGCDVTLPAAAPVGTNYTFIARAADSMDPLTVVQADGEHLWLAGLTLPLIEAAVGLTTAGTPPLCAGTSIKLVSDGQGSWFAVSATGSWEKIADE
jgi:hypothetical protein